MSKILVIDDSKTVRTMCEWIYKGLEDTLITASSASEADGIISSQSPDVIFVDYTLDGSDVNEFIKKHSAQGRKLVLLAGTYAPCDPDAARAAGAVSVINKPFKSDDFYNAVADALNGVAAPAEPAVAAPSAPVQETATQTVAPISGISGVVPSIPAFKSSSSLNSIPSPNNAPKRFNFPGSNPSSSLNPVVPSSPSSPAIDKQAFADAKPADQATPKTPVPSISPAVLAAQAEVAATVQNEVNADVSAVVKEILPQLVNEYLKTSMRAEINTYFTNSIMPQLQKWVDARVVAIVRKMTQK